MAHNSLLEVAAICTASLLSGIFAFVLGNLSFIPGIHPAAYVAIVIGIIGVALALISLRQCKRKSRHAGKSVWGAVLSILALLISVVSIILMHSY